MNPIDDPALLSLPRCEAAEFFGAPPPMVVYRPGRIGDVVEVDPDAVLWQPMRG